MTTMSPAKVPIKPRRLLLTVALVSIVLAVPVWFGAQWWQGREPAVQVAFLDVGQGDAIYVRTPSGFDILVDGGPDNTVLERLGQVMPFYDRDLDLVVLTHPDADHLMGLVEVLQRFRVHRVWVNGGTKDTAVYRTWAERLADEEATVTIVTTGYSFAIDDGTKLQVLHPDTPAIDAKEPNNEGVVVKLSFGNQELLLTGDIEQEPEAAIVQRFRSQPETLRSEILKVGHHGSKTSSTPVFLETVHPELAVISVGLENRYGHPSQEVLDRFTALGIPVLRTDCLGTIRLKLTATAYTVRTPTSPCRQKEP